MDKSAGVSLIVFGVLITAVSIGLYYAAIPPDMPDMPMPSCGCCFGPLIVMGGVAVLGMVSRQAGRKTGQETVFKGHADQP
jgi:hypothetical protein